MDRNQAKQLLPIIEAFSKGKQMQFLFDVWRDVDEIGIREFLENPELYRIKPEQKYRTFKDAEECWTEMQKHQPFGWVKYLNCYYNITAVSNTDVVLANFSRCTFTQSFIKIMNDYTFADGTPFGVKIEEE